MPHEVDKLIALLKSTKASNAMIVSGDRHISEFSKLNDSKLPYPLVDFTSSGLTHSYASFEGEPNPYRVGAVVADRSFGLVGFDLNAQKVSFSIHTDSIAYKQELLIDYN
jgi:alkaline phosphatase D